MSEARSGAASRSFPDIASLIRATMFANVIARSEATKQSGVHATGYGLFRGACHRAALRADPLARNDASSNHHPPRLDNLEHAREFVHQRQNKRLVCIGKTPVEHDVLAFGLGAIEPDAEHIP